MATILVVDDQPTNRDLLVTLLGYRGHRLLEAVDGAAALALVQAEQPDLVITDILMPTMDGYEFVHHLRAIPSLAPPPVIFCTAHYREREAQELAQAYGVTHILVKPYEPEEVLRVVDGVLGDSSPQPAVAAPASSETLDRAHLNLLTDKLAQKVDELQAANERLTLLIELGQRLAAEHDPLALLVTCCDAARALVGASYAIIGLYDDTGQYLQQFLPSGIDAETAGRIAALPPRPDLLGGALAERAGLSLRDLSGDPQTLGLPTGHPPVFTLLGVPISSPTRVYGWLCLTNKLGAAAFSAADERLAAMLSGQLAIAYENARRYDAIQRHATALEQEVARRTQAEEALRQREAHLRLITDALPVLVAYVDPEQRYRFNNRAFEAWFEQDRAEITGKPMREALGEPAYAVLQPYIEAALRGQHVTFEALVPYQVGGARYVLATYVPDLDEQGHVRGFVTLVSDLTERKRAEEAQRLLADASTLLAASLDYEQTLAQVAHLAVSAMGGRCVVDLVGDNGAIQRIAVGHADPTEEAAASVLQRYPPGDDAASLVPHVLRTGQPELITAVPGAMVQRGTSTGEQRAALHALGAGSAMITPLVARGRTLGALSFVAAEPERYGPADLAVAMELARRCALALDNARLYEAERRAHAEAEAALQLRDEFLSIASHELKTPVTAVLGYAQILVQRAEREPTTGGRNRRALQVIKDQSERLSKLIGTMLDLSRIQTGRLNMEAAPLELCALARRVVEAIHPTLEQHTLELTCADEPLIIAGDELRLEQVLQNLLSNAIKYSPAGGWIQVCVEQRDEQACLVVRDQGIGIPEQAQSRLFERFYRAPNVDRGNISGFGIGLYVVHEIVSRHGGRVEVASAPGAGSTFRVYLPLPLPDAIRLPPA